MQQGGSVMCDRSVMCKGSDPAHPKFWHNCLLNEEQIAKPKNSSNFQKLVCERKDSLLSK